MTARKLRFLFIQPEFNRHYVTFLPVYEPLHGLICDSVSGDLTESLIFDRRFDTDRNLRKTLRDFKPDVIGTTAHTAGEVTNSIRLLALAKEERPEAVTIVGGQHATLLPEDYFHPAVDLICIGPAEGTFKETMETIASGEDLAQVPGLVVRQGDEHVVTPPRELRSGIVSWPQFDRTIIPKRYRRHYYFIFEARPSIYTITTMGCPYRCKFCSLWAAQRGTYRRRPPEEIVEDIASQSQTYVHLTDDNTFHDEKHALEIYELMKKRGVKKKIMAYARTDTIVQKSDLLEKWLEIGLGGLVVGMEAVSDSNLEYINKKTSVDVNEQAHKVLEKLGIENWAHFVMLPDFKKEDFDQVWDFIDRLNITYPVLVPLTPIPGTPLFFEAKEEKLLTTFDYGFYNLEYMVMKTILPKREWYDHMADLYLKTCSPRTLWRRRKSPSFHYRPGIGRAIVMRNTVRKIDKHVEEQLEMERTVRYEDIEHTLPPSLRRDYVPDKYYNAPTLAAMKEMEPVEAAV